MGVAFFFLINEIKGVVQHIEMAGVERSGIIDCPSTYELNLKMPMLIATVRTSFSSPLYKIWLYITHLVWAHNALFRDQKFCRLVIVVPGHRQ